MSLHKIQQGIVKDNQNLKARLSQLKSSTRSKYASQPEICMSSSSRLGLESYQPQICIPVCNMHVKLHPGLSRHGLSHLGLSNTPQPQWRSASKIPENMFHDQHGISPGPEEFLVKRSFVGKLGMSSTTFVLCPKPKNASKIGFWEYLYDISSLARFWPTYFTPDLLFSYNFRGA